MHIARFPDRADLLPLADSELVAALESADRRARRGAGGDRAAAQGEADRQLAAGEGGRRGAGGPILELLQRHAADLPMLFIVSSVELRRERQRSDRSDDRACRRRASASAAGDMSRPSRGIPNGRACASAARTRSPRRSMDDEVVAVRRGLGAALEVGVPLLMLVLDQITKELVSAHARPAREHDGYSGVARLHARAQHGRGVRHPRTAPISPTRRS